MTLEPVGVTVYEWRVLGREGADLNVEIHCSGGTYVRALARDLGEAAASAAHLAALRRMRSGRFDVADALPLEDVQHGKFELIAPTTAVAQLPRKTLDDLDARRVTHGQIVSATAETTDEVVALCHEDELIAVAVRDGDTWRPKVVMRDA